MSLYTALSVHYHPSRKPNFTLRIIVRVPGDHSLDQIFFGPNRIHQRVPDFYEIQQ